MSSIIEKAIEVSNLQKFATVRTQFINSRTGVTEAKKEFAEIYKFSVDLCSQINSTVDPQVQLTIKQIPSGNTFPFGIGTPAIDNFLLAVPGLNVGWLVEFIYMYADSLRGSDNVYARLLVRSSPNSPKTHTVITAGVDVEPAVIPMRLGWTFGSDWKSSESAAEFIITSLLEKLEVKIKQEMK